MFVTKKLWIHRDPKIKKHWIELLTYNDLHPEEHVDYTVGIFDGDRLIATGSTYQNIIKLVAICGDYQNQNLLTQVITHLSNYLWDKDETRVFLYTKPSSVKYFQSIGFRDIVKTDAVCLMERGTPSFDDYANELREVKRDSARNGAIVMNANPFTKGHLFLVETALAQCDHLYIFILSDESSKFSFKDRLRLVKHGTEYLENVTVLPSDQYQVSQATFPSYFLKDQAEEEIAKQQAQLDAKLFSEAIAPLLNIQVRFAGEEPLSRVTEIYNEAMRENFEGRIQFVVIPRKQIEGEVISATRVRTAYQEDNFSLIQQLVPSTTYDFLVHDKNKQTE